MSLSESYNFSQDRDSIIKDSLRLAGVIDYSGDGNVDPEMLSDSSRIMNRMFKAWAADGLQVWKQTPAKLFLEEGKYEYLLGTQGDRWLVDYIDRTIASTGTLATGTTTFSVSAAAGMADNDVIGVTLDDKTIQWTTVSTVNIVGKLVTLATGLTGPATFGNVFYFYAAPSQRPYRITEAIRRDTSKNDIEILIISREEYWNLANKTTKGTVTQLFYDQALPDGKLYVYNAPDNSTDILELIVHFPFSDMDAGSDDIDFPDYWYEAVVHGLAYRISVEYRSPRDIRSELRGMASFSKSAALDFDVEGTSVFFQPDKRGLR